MFTEEHDGPIFVYAHSNLPGHSQNSGQCLPNEVELFRDRLTAANMEMNVDLNTVIEHDPGAIIIVAGDHGPYLTKNCMNTDEAYDMSEITRLDIQDRFGTFLAIRWPTGDYEEHDDITVLQDLFPAVFSYLFQDSRFLEAKVHPTTLAGFRVSEVHVVDGVIEGGVDSGEPLFVGTNGE